MIAREAPYARGVEGLNEYDDDDVDRDLELLSGGQRREEGDGEREKAATGRWETGARTWMDHTMWYAAVTFPKFLTM